MRTNPRAMFTYLGLMLLIALCLGATNGPKPRSATMPSRPAAAGGTLPNLAGSWAGGWVDTVFTVAGPMNVTIDVNGSTVTATGTMNLYFVGLGFSEPFSLTGTISSNDLSFTYQFDAASALTSTGSGDLTAVGAAIGDLAGDGNVGDPLFNGDYTFTGTAVEGAITGLFSYGPGNGAGAFGLSRTSAVEPDSWGEIKNRYRAGG